MNRRVWTGLLAGILAATVILGVAGAAYRAGQINEVVTQTVGDGQVVPVVGGDYGGWGCRARCEIEAQVDGPHPRDDRHLASLLEETQLLGRLIDDLGNPGPG